VVGLAAAASNPVPTYQTAISSSLAPKGPYASSALVLVKDNGDVAVLNRQGAPPLTSVTDPSVTALYKRAAATASLVTSRAVGGSTQRLGYLLSAKGSGGTFVVAASQELPLPDRIAIPRGQPDTNLNLALYFGKTIRPADQILTTRSTPHGITSTARVPFGNNTLTVVASPRASLAGAWAKGLPWGILVVGIITSFVSALEVARLIRRRAQAEDASRFNRTLYEQQRSISETLQRSLLPSSLPTFPGVDIAVSYLPGTRDAEVGDDWYSVVPVDDDHFVFVVGDVSGHGIEAAGMMASLRQSTRTLAKLGLPPEEILQRADEDIDITDESSHFATALVGSVSMATQELVIASAGHPPVYLLSGEGGGFITMTTGAPLGLTLAGPPQPTTVPFVAV
jgi:hypothetical protein